MLPTDPVQRQQWHQALVAQRLVAALGAWQRAEANRRPAALVATLAAAYQQEALVAGQLRDVHDRSA